MPANTQTDTPSGSTVHQRPYVGLRPFEAHERDLFRGRDRDAQFLVDKILSAKLTIFFAHSGVGKSSLLHTLVIPELESERCLAVYFNTWAGRDPLGTLKGTLVAELRKLDVADPEAGAPSLRDLVRLVATSTGRTAVLVLDQFEELLAGPGEPPAQLRRELAELVRATDVDARIVMALREEFLAALEPFRSDIVNLFQSTFRLERLDEAGVLKAIIEPACLFDITYEPALVERLLQDLRAGGADHPGGEPGNSVDLPMLQLVCDQLWNRVDRGAGTITLALYEQLGGAAAIIKEYVGRTMPRQWRARLHTARLLKFLAPPSGLKISYSVADLAAYSQLGPRAIEKVLQHLCSSRILRSRIVQGEERFELQHDAFIQILVPWRKAVQCALTRLRIAGAAVVLIVCAVAGPAVAGYLMAEFEYHREVRRKLPFLEQQCGTDVKQAAATLEDITRHLLLRASRESRLNDLRQVLASNEGCLPESYGVDTAGLGFVEEAVKPDWPVRLRYSSSRRLNSRYFAATWHALSQALANQWGVPLPSRVTFVEEQTMPPRFVELVLPGGRPLQVDDVPLHETRAFLSEAGLSSAAAEFIGKFKSDWSPAPELKHGGPWLVVPRWALPILAATNDEAIDGSGYLALRLVTELQANPALMLTPPAIELLLARAAEQEPITVAESRRVRSGLLRDDLAAVIARGIPFTNVPLILDALARYPATVPPAKAAELVEQDLASPRIRLSDHDGAPHAAAAAPRQAPLELDAKDRQVYADVESWLPGPSRPVRVYLGRDLVSRWTKNETELNAELLEELQRVRDDFWRRFGLEVPGVRFYPDDSGIPASAFRIEVLNQTPRDVDARPIVVGADAPLAGLVPALRARMEVARIHWLTAVDVQILRDSFDGAFRQWLNTRYSATELKTLLQAVISPTKEELDARAKADAGAVYPVDPSFTVRHRKWLVQSLVFWDAADIRGLGEAAQRLRETQASLRSRDGASRISAANHVTRGIAALDRGRVGEAANAFSLAIEGDRDGAIRAFLAAYPESLVQALDREMRTACADPPHPQLSRTQVVELEEITERSGERQLMLCLFAAHPETTPVRRRALAARLVKEHGDPASWPAAEAAWFGQELVLTYDPLRDMPEFLERASRFVKNAVQRLEYAASAHLIETVAGVCQKDGPKNWCWVLLDEVARVRPEGAIPETLAWYLSWRQRPADLQRALEWSVMPATDGRNPSMSPARLFARAQALKGLADAAEGRTQEEAERLFRPLMDSSVDGIAQSAHEQMIELALADGRYTEADIMLATAMKRWPKAATLYIQKFWVDLLEGRTESAAATARDAGRLAEADDANQDFGFLFVAALGQILTKTGRWEHAGRRLIGSTHPYVDYIHMLLYASLAESRGSEADELLKLRWTAIDPKSWDARMRQGDEAAWRETLIGYYVGQVDGERIIRILEADEAFAASPYAHLPLPRQGLLCEAYFYDAIRAKVAGNMTRMRSSLQRTLDTGMQSYFEYKMARFLLRGSQMAAWRP